VEEEGTTWCVARGRLRDRRTKGERTADATTLWVSRRLASVYEMS